MSVGNLAIVAILPVVSSLVFRCDFSISQVSLLVPGSIILEFSSVIPGDLPHHYLGFG